MLIIRRLRAIVLFALPTRVARVVLGRYGQSIHPRARIGFSWVEVGTLEMAEGSRIGHANYIRIPKLQLGEKSVISLANFIKGDFEIRCAERGAIGKRNVISRGNQPTGPSVLCLGQWAKITASHSVDMTRDVTIGDFSILAGKATQIWTHGFVHAETGLDRYRLDGEVSIGSNVYVGARCFISMGVTIGDAVIVGGGTSVAKSLLEKGMYVSGPVRRLPRPGDPEERQDLERDNAYKDWIVYRKRTD